MKKIMQRFLGIAAAAALIVTYAVPVAASSNHTHKEGEKIDDTSFSPQYTITLKEPEGVTIADGAHYGAYQIFSGTVKNDPSKDPIEEPGDTNEKIPITDIKWGNAFGDVDALAGGSGSSGKEQWQSNIVKFVYALATASNIGENPDYAYAFKGFDDFEGFAGAAKNTLADEFYFDPSGSKTDYNNVNFDKLAVKVADVLSTKNDRQWLQMFADILGGYAKGTEGGYATTGYAVRYYESTQKKDAVGNPLHEHEIKVPAGYYMIRDFSTIEDDEADSAFSARLLFVANNITQTLKSDVPTLEKHIIRTAVGDALENLATKDKTEWDTEAAGVGDVVTFQLKATLPSDYDNFLGGYTFTFTDTPEAGLTVDADNVKITVVGAYPVTKDATGKETDGTWYNTKPLTITTKSFEAATDHEHFKSTDAEAYTAKVDGNVLTVDFPCLKEIRITEDGNTYRLGYRDDDEMSTIYVTYTATVNSNAVVSPYVSPTDKGGNTNKAVLTYSDNPQSYKDTDFTSAKSATVYTYGTEITKVDAAEFIKENNTTAASALLPGAEFALVREDPITKGSYQIAALGTTPVASGGKEYTPVTAWNTLGEAADDKSIQSITKEYVDKQTTAGAYAVNCTVTSDVNGSIKISGLNDGVTYYLVEVAPPSVDTYATIDPFTLTLTAATENGEYTGLLAEKDGVVVNHEIKGDDTLSINNFVQIVNEATTSTADTNGIAELIVANFKYVDLPSTGGTGTYIFYIIGGVVVAASLVLFFLSRKKTTK